MLGDPTPHKKLCKQQVLNATIAYIKDLLSILNEPSHVKVRPAACMHACIIQCTVHFRNKWY